MKKVFFISILFFVFIFLFLFQKKGNSNIIPSGKVRFWEFQSIDTMKFSRDMARTKLGDLSFDKTIAYQVSQIAATGANYLAVATPYDSEFIPFLKRWVTSARKNDLKVWFRGNFSGWEEWFGYKSITRIQHEKLLKDFITNNSDLFENGDIFSACPECENGGPGDPRQNGDIEGHRNFLIEEYKISKDTFRLIGKNVVTSYNPMNGDVARIIMDNDTTQALGGIVVIDHYVPTPDKLITDIKDFAKISGGKVVLGEFGVPIPDINGKLSDDEQAKYIKTVLNGLTNVSEVIGINYWTSFGGSTQIWNDDGIPRLAISEIKAFFKPPVLKGYVVNEIGNPVEGALITIGNLNTYSGSGGQFSTPYLASNPVAKVSAPGYISKNITNVTDSDILNVSLVKIKESIFFEMAKIFSNLFK